MIKKSLLLLIVGIFSNGFLNAQTGQPSGANSKLDTITPVNCIIEYMVSYDSTMYIPDGDNCPGMPACYNTLVTYTSFPAGASITNASDILSVCMTIEHSFLGDLQFRLICPNGNSAITHIQPNGGGLFLGVPVDGADNCNPDPNLRGIGWNYCWSENPGYSYHGADTSSHYLSLNQVGSSCDSTNRINHTNYYSPMNSFSSLVGCPLNGTWSLEICDYWAIDDGWISGWSLEVSHLSTFATGGRLFYDINENCQQDAYEIGLANRMAVIEPAGISIITNSSGFWWVDSLPVGNYTMTVDTTNNWISTCQSAQSFSVLDSGITVAPCFGLKSTVQCSAPNVSIVAPILRPCFTNQNIYVRAMNEFDATNILYNPYVDVTIDTALTVTGSSIPFTMVGSNVYRFQLGNLYPNQHVDFTIQTTVSCYALLGQTACMEAKLYPVEACVYDSVQTPEYPEGVTPCTLPWDHSSLSVNGWCSNDTVYFSVTNTGDPINGDMDCYAPIRVYLDGVLIHLDSVLIAGGQSVVFAYPGNGQTWILQADQHPLHPGNSHPNAHVEACGDVSNWTPGLVNNLPLDDAEPFVDIFCGTITGSFDPNDKTGYPTGVGATHGVIQDQQIQYVIRFQNTGTDTAFTVVVRDTLDADMDIFSIIPGVSSHPYTFRVYGPRVMEWSFNHILLPDSNTNEPASHGFLSYTVDMLPGLPVGTKIHNTADIYFDYNTPVITNTTLHTINKIKLVLPIGIEEVANAKNEGVSVFPNPAVDQVMVIVNPELIGETYVLYDQTGKELFRGILTDKETKINLNKYQYGLYLLRIGNNHKVTLKVVKK